MLAPGQRPMINSPATNMKPHLLTLVLASTGAVSQPAAQAQAAFEKIVLTDKYHCDGINTGDFNRDGKPDVVAGPYWYPGPRFQEAREFYPAVVHPTEPSPTDSMFSFVHDFNHDGWPDILVCGRVHKHQAFWYENPHNQPGLWKKHFVFERVQGESPALLDINHDGQPEILCLWENQWGWIHPDPKHPTQPWSFHPITPKGDWHHFYHGMGIGDVNSDGRSDLLLNEGWWEQPAPPDNSRPWTEHPCRFAEKGGAQMFAFDIDGDGDNDIVSSLDSHGWGLAWFEQTQTNGRRTFQKHVIMGDRSEESRYGAAFTQPHALALADINGDGTLDIITGKRLWAHGPTGDIEPNAAPVVYWFELDRQPGRIPRFIPHLVDDKSGVGVQITTADLNNDARPDILTTSKLGAFLFLSR